ncbi:reverse transcriptase domain-containing protein [Tanacetum coccineum]
MTKDIQCQLPPKELNPGNFTLPYTIGNFNFYGMADLGASVNVMPRNTFEYSRLANLRNTNMLVEMADMTKKAHLVIIENILVRINKFLFLSDFVIINKTPNETISLGMPFLATIHVEIDVFDKKNSLGVDNSRVSYDIEKKDHNFTTPTEEIFMIKSDLENRPQSPTCNDNQSRNLPDRSPNDNVHRDNTYWWHDHEFEKEECDEIEIKVEKHDPPEVQVETFEVPAAKRQLSRPTQPIIVW